MADQKPLEENELELEEQISENAKRNQEILKKTARIERIVLIVLTIAMLVAILAKALQTLL